ncbi:MAG: M1 family metallopeptidase [Flavobacteriales bacterium]|nr:M1 family metallopeptidase [Flavobacteriales bacterium]
MRYFIYLLFVGFSVLSWAQDLEEKKVFEKGHTNTNKFRQLYDEFATPTTYRTASGAPGTSYYQQRADYKMDIELDDSKQKIYGSSTITYYNNSPDPLDFLWVQMDQNKNKKGSDSNCMNGHKLETIEKPKEFITDHLLEEFDGGFDIDYIKDAKGNDLKHFINKTMMRIDLDEPLLPGKKFVFKTKWSYNIVDHTIHRERSGYEYFKWDNNYLYVIAQFYPRMAVYNETEGWQNTPFWGDAEFNLSFGDFEVNITVPSDHIVEGTGVLVNRKEVFTPTQYERFQKATKSYDKPVIIVSQEEAMEKEKSFAKTKKTWRFKATKVRDFAFASSRKFIMDAMAVQLGDKTVMATSLYPKEGNPLWEQYSTRVVAHTLKSYSEMTFDYPYHKAVSVHSYNQGMEYPMICWNYGRPDDAGYVAEHVKNGMISVIIHEIGHNWFPMIVNSDERQWAWMDEGLNSFLEYLTEQKWEKGFPSRRGPVEKVIPYMSSEQRFLEPIMTNPENIRNLGGNAYTKPASALNILRETVMEPELFDHAFKVYANRWKFKQPTPEDFFRTMEDASAMDLDWFWRGWFYTTDYVDVAVKGVTQFYVTDEPNQEVKDYLKKMNREITDIVPLVYSVYKGSVDYKEGMDKPFELEEVKPLKEYVEENFTLTERAKLKKPKYFYEVVFENKGGLVMPLIVEITYEDNTSEQYKYPAQLWRRNHEEVVKIYGTQKRIKKILVDPNMELADVNAENNIWPPLEGDTPKEIE